MPRDHARLLTKMWRDDEDWRSLPVQAQHMYFLLLSQPTLSYAGTLDITMTRWARLADGLTVDQIDKAIRLLEDRRFLVIDWATEELMIRTFLRNDGVYKQPNPLKAAVRVAIDEVESDLIREAMATELRRVGLHHLADRLNPSGNPSPNPPDRSTDDLSEPSRLKGSANPSNTPSQRGISKDPPKSGGKGEGGVVSSQSRSSSASGAAKRGTRIPDDFAVSADMVRWARSKCPAVDGKRETEKFINHFRSAPGSKGLKLDWPRTWMNWMMTADERLPTQIRSASSQAAVLSDDPVIAFADLRKRGDAKVAAKLAGCSWIEPAQPPNEPMPYPEWSYLRRVEFIDAHETEIRAALGRQERSAG
jgi:hypothetical protein